MPGLIKDNKKVIALAQGGIEFYPIQKNSDGSVTVEGSKYVKNIAGKKATVENYATVYGPCLTKTNDNDFDASHYVDQMMDYTEIVNKWDVIVIGRHGNRYIVRSADTNNPYSGSYRYYTKEYAEVYKIYGEIQRGAFLYEVDPEDIEISGGVISPANPHRIKVYVTPELEVA